MEDIIKDNSEGKMMDRLARVEQLIYGKSYNDIQRNNIKNSFIIALVEYVPDEVWDQAILKVKNGLARSDFSLPKPVLN